MRLTALWGVFAARLLRPLLRCSAHFLWYGSVGPSPPTGPIRGLTPSAWRRSRRVFSRGRFWLLPLVPLRGSCSPPAPSGSLEPPHDHPPSLEALCPLCAALLIGLLSALSLRPSLRRFCAVILVQGRSQVPPWLLTHKKRLSSRLPPGLSHVLGPGSDVSP